MLRSFLLFISASLVFHFCTAQTEFDLNPADFASRINAEKTALVLDVRTSKEFSTEHLINARNITWNADNFEAQIASIDKSKPVYVYCLSGARSDAAANRMRTLGYTVYELQGGILKWKENNLPVEGEGKQDRGMTMARYNVLTNSKKLVLVDFYAQWCAPCKKMKPYFDEISKNMNDKVEVVRINVDENPQLVKGLGIGSLPVVNLYRQNKLVWSNQGFTSREQMIKEIETYSR